MRIAVCDDNDICERIGKENMESVKLINIFQNAAMGKNYDAIIVNLDGKITKYMDMLEEVGKQLRTTKIVFVSSKPGSYIEEVSMRNYNFGGMIESKNIETTIPMLVKKLDNKSCDNDKLAIHYHGNVFVENYDDIIYLECSGHNVYVHCNKKTYKLYTSMSQLENKLPVAFARCHKSFNVNMKHIKRIDGQEIELTSGDVIFINKARMKAFKDAYERYMECISV